MASTDERSKRDSEYSIIESACRYIKIVEELAKGFKATICADRSYISRSFNK